MSEKRRYSICVDFDGVLHSYLSPWKNARTIPDPPVPGAIEWLVDISNHFDVAIFTTRNHQWGGRRAIKAWLRHHLREHFWPWVAKVAKSTHMDADDEAADVLARDVLDRLSFPKHKPAALVYLDDRAWRFAGTFPTKEQIHQARPWKVGQPVGGRA
jgi:hypothetical protein